jgi:thymidylate synthase
MSNLLLILLWLSRDQISRSIFEKVAYAGTVYTADAVNTVIKALYEVYDYVDTVIVYGPDINSAGELIVEALSGVCNDAVRAPCEYVKGLNVRVVDLRWRGEEELRRAVEAFYKPTAEAARPRREVPLERPNKRLTCWAPHVLYDDDLEALRVKAIDYILTYGAESRDVLYSHLALQRRPGGKYLARPCDVLEDWPCGLEEADVLLATPAYILKSRLEAAMSAIRPEVYGRDVYDPRGNFVLTDSSLYHYSPRGVLLRQIELTDINMRREAQKLLPDHAFYLGQEYAARKILKDKYVQDRWKLQL